MLAIYKELLYYHNNTMSLAGCGGKIPGLVECKLDIKRKEHGVPSDALSTWRSVFEPSAKVHLHT